MASLSVNSFSQSSIGFNPSVKYMYYQSLFPVYEYSGRTTPSVKKEILSEALSLGDIAPELWHKLSMPYNERIDLDQLIGINYPKGYNFSYPPENSYMKVVEYASVEISIVHKGKAYEATSINNILTAEQKHLLSLADLGSDIRIKIKFKYKNSLTGYSNRKRIKGEFTITVVPEKEAEYQGGLKKMTEYLTKNIINKIAEEKTSEIMQQAVFKFTVSEEGRIMDVKIVSSPIDSKTAKLIFEAIYNMPVWKPAENSKGVKVKQEFSLPVVGNAGGC